MSIDARITAVERNSVDGTALIKLEPLTPTGGPAGQVLLVLNAPAFFEAAIGTEIHADMHIVRVQGKRWAERIGCTKLRLVCLALLLWTVPAWGQFQFPEVTPPIPPPAPPGTVPVLPAKTLYAIYNPQPFFVRLSPGGLATVTMRNGPITIYGAFIEDPTKTVFRDFPAGQVALIEAAGTGRVEIILIPSGVTKDVDIVSRLVDCLVGPLPPPPIPPVPPDPPVPPIPPGPAPDPTLVGKFREALTRDIANGSTKQMAQDLAIVYESSAVLLDLGDPAIAPKTVGELYTKTFNASVEKGIPRRPALNNTRNVVDLVIGMQTAEAPMTPVLKQEFKTKYLTIATALKEASK